MADLHALSAELQESRERFLALVADIRPDLHRYCARMTGSIAAGEDVVQETLAHAYYALAFTDGMITTIRDFRYVPYIASEAAIEIELP